MRFFGDPGFSDLLFKSPGVGHRCAYSTRPDGEVVAPVSLYPIFGFGLTGRSRKQRKTLGVNYDTSRSIYIEKGESIGDMLQQKIYEYYGFHHTVGGRRTAALVAAQYMQRYDLHVHGVRRLIRGPNALSTIRVWNIQVRAHTDRLGHHRRVGERVV